MRIHELPTNEQPRERLIALGPDALSDAELLAVLMRTGYQGVSVVQLAQNVLAAEGGLLQLLQLSCSDFCRHKGLGQAKYVMLQASIALARRSIFQRLQRQGLSCVNDVSDYLRIQLACETREVFGVLFLDNGHSLLHFAKLFYGSLTATQVDVAEIMRSALSCRASALILCHNHPSGRVDPSSADDAVTHQIAAAGQMLNIRVLDHVIVGYGALYSYAEHKPEILTGLAK